MLTVFKGKAVAYGETADGREVVVQIRTDHPTITIGRKQSPVHSEQWIYETPERAVRAFLTWDPATEPEPDAYYKRRKKHV